MKHLEPAIRNLARNAQVRPELRLAGQDELTVEYAPFDYVELGAKLAIVGLTPGRTQAELALSEMSRRLRAGEPWETAGEHAKRAASFGGPMRSNLIRLIHSVGLASALGFESATSLFSPEQRRVHYTSVLRYPVFVRSKNYSGEPAPLAHPLLRRFIEDYFSKELEQLPGIIWLPLGTPAQTVLKDMMERGRLNEDQILFGMPHPSGANAERIAYFTGSKPRAACSPKTNCYTLDLQREQILGKIQKLAQAGRTRALGP